MKPFNLNKIKAEDAVNDTKRDVPFRFGHELKVNLGLENAGVWNELENGDRIWRINIISEGATSLNFVFSNYEVPRGAKIYLYSNDRKDLLGAYTNIFNRPDKLLGTWMVAGDNVWIEYYEPASVKGQGEPYYYKSNTWVSFGYRCNGT